MRIQRLDPILANQIAAGEVIDRPAAVLKELIENALDAKADDIQVEIEQGGVRKIVVRDNGVGIDAEDLLLAFERHATSKLMHLNDLYALRTLGFRGEALAATSSVAKVRIASKTKDAPAAVIENKGGLLGLVLPVAHPLGTTVEVSDLFFNTPVRRRFLRSEKTETQQLEEIFKRLLLSHFQIGFQWRSYGVTKHYPKAMTQAAQQARIAQVVGKKFISNSIFMDINRLGLRLWGWIGLEACARKQADNQYFFVNQRSIKDRVLNHAIKSIFLELYPLSEGSHSTFVLFLEIDPSQVDVNVHPTKLEVRFSESRLVHDFIFFAIKSAFEQKPSFVQSISDNLIFPLIKQNNWVKPQQSLVSSSVSPSSERYILFESKNTIYIIDWQYALKPISYVYFKDKLLQNQLIGKPLLFPREIDISAITIELNWQKALEKIGISFKIDLERIFVLQAPEGINLDKIGDFFQKLSTLSIEGDLSLTLLSALSEYTRLEFIMNIDFRSILEKWEDLDSSGFAYPIDRLVLNFFLGSAKLSHCDSLL